MRDRIAGRAALVTALCFAWQARADDPCLAAQPSGNPLIDLTNLMAQQQRNQECTTLRQAQWAAYNAHQKSVQETQGSSGSQQTAQVNQEGKVGGTEPVPRNPPALSGNAPQNALQMMAGALGSLRDLRGAYAATPRARYGQPYPR